MTGLQLLKLGDSLFQGVDACRELDVQVLDLLIVSWQTALLYPGVQSAYRIPLQRVAVVSEFFEGSGGGLLMGVETVHQALVPES